MAFGGCLVLYDGRGLNNSRSSRPYFVYFVCCIIAHNVKALTSLMVTLCEDFLLAFITGAMRSLSM